ncbi:MAG TPA: hypothetical protein VLC79_06655 [Cellvibrio sp.]|nr:hypothetical protein [Cellvibrio sp.]
MEVVINRRMILSKEFYLQGKELATMNDSLSKMMAVHNFHISIEIILKAILLKYEIRTERTLNIDFESMLNEIDSDNTFKAKGVKLPYRQEIRSLNQMRNLVQHQAIEPEKSTMDDWRLYTSRFLEKVFLQYFNAEFKDIDRSSFINCETLKSLLNKSNNELQDLNFESASAILAACFESAYMSIVEFIPRSSASFFALSSLRGPEYSGRELRDALEKTHERINSVEKFSVLLASGVNLPDYSKYKDSIPFVHIMAGGGFVFDTWQGKEFTEASTKWLHYFIINTVLNWQQLGLEPKIPEHLVKGAKKLIEE